MNKLKDPPEGQIVNIFAGIEKRKLKFALRALGETEEQLHGFVASIKNNQKRDELIDKMIAQGVTYQNMRIFVLVEECANGLPVINIKKGSKQWQYMSKMRIVSNPTEGSEASASNTDPFIQMTRFRHRQISFVDDDGVRLLKSAPPVHAPSFQEILQEKIREKVRKYIPKIDLMINIIEFMGPQKPPLDNTPRIITVPIPELTQEVHEMHMVLDAALRGMRSFFMV